MSNWLEICIECNSRVVKYDGTDHFIYKIGHLLSVYSNWFQWSKLQKPFWRNIYCPKINKLTKNYYSTKTFTNTICKLKYTAKLFIAVDEEF